VYMGTRIYKYAACFHVHVVVVLVANVNEKNIEMTLNLHPINKTYLHFCWANVH